MISTQYAGQQAERMALEYLSKQGLKLVTHNYRCKMGEIDLIMRDGQYLVFIEVRSRKNQSYGDGIASISYAKIQKIIKTTLYYVMVHKLQERNPIRFDVISIDGNNQSIDWIKDAFRAEY